MVNNTKQAIEEEQFTPLGEVATAVLLICFAIGTWAVCQVLWGIFA